MHVTFFELTFLQLLIISAKKYDKPFTNSIILSGRVWLNAIQLCLYEIYSIDEVKILLECD